jgi:MFS family permease
MVSVALPLPSKSPHSPRKQIMDRGRLFFASCLALITTSMVFSIRGDILDALGADFHLNNEQMGLVLSPAFWGFTLSIIIGGSLVDFLGMKRLLVLSSVLYIGAVLAIVFAPRPTAPVAPYYSDTGFLILYGSMLTLGLAQGLVEAVINPLCATIFAEQKTQKLNVLHAWWPGGLIIGGLAAFAITNIMGLGQGVSNEQATLGWQVKLCLLLVPAAVFGIIAMRQQFPATERVAAGVSSGEMVRETIRPMFLLWFCLMWMTAATELGPDQWVASLITNLAGMQGIHILVYTSGIMFLLRFFGGGLAHKVSPIGLLALASIFSAIGLFSLGAVSTPMQAFAAATIFGIGKAYFWPVMIGVTSELFPKGGSMAMAIIGGAGMLSTAFILPIMGEWYDAYGAAAAFRYVGVLPIILTVAFGLLFVYFKSRGGYRAIKIEGTEAA